MDVETAIQAFASAGNDLPREAMQWALDHWDEVAPELLSVRGALHQRSGPVGRGRECGPFHPPPCGREAGHARVPAPVPPRAGR